jgi:acyl transferase domain-containing protein/glutamate-1-semialdehyde aminotransferase
MLENIKSFIEFNIQKNNDFKFVKIDQTQISFEDLSNNLVLIEKKLSKSNVLNFSSVLERLSVVIYIAVNKISFSDLKTNSIIVLDNMPFDEKNLLDSDFGLNIQIENIFKNIFNLETFSLSSNSFTSFLEGFVPGVELHTQQKKEKINIEGTKYPRPELSVAFIKPNSEIEKSVTAIWEKHLNISGIGLDDTFFELGGNSILALTILAQINKLQNKKISIVKLFQYPTVRVICEYLEGSTDNVIKKIIKKNNQSRDVAVIAMTGRFPNSNSISEFWDKIKDSKNCIDLFDDKDLHPSVDQDQLLNPNFVKVAGLYPGYDEFDSQYFGMTPKEAEILDPQHRKVLELSVEVFENAAINPMSYPGRIGVYLGMANTTYIQNIYTHKDVLNNFGELNISFSNEKDYLATRVAYKLNLKGPAVSVHTACSTSLVTIIEAVKAIRNEECEMALAGGISINGQPNKGHIFQEGGILTKNGKCSPFDNEATGTAFNDGGGIVLLKDMESALRDNDNILAVIKGVATNNDGAQKMSFTAPSVMGQAQVITDALMDAELSAEDINYVEAHGTGTPVGDPIELEALTTAYKAFTNEKSYCYIGSVKSNIGHLTSAAGVAGFIKATKVLETKQIPVMANFNSENINIDFKETPFLVNKSIVDLESKPVINIGISSFGVGGTNAHLILQSYDNKYQFNSGNHENLFNISAKNDSQLLELEKNLLSKLKVTNPNKWSALSFSLNTGRVDQICRKSLVISEDNISKISKSLITKNKISAKKELYFMFPGQGSQYIGMGKELYNKYDVFRNSFDRCCEILNNHLNKNIKNIIFAENMSEENAYDALKNTYYTQPALFAIEFSLANLLLDFDIDLKGCIGHSVGEFVAATLAGVFTLEDALMLISKRASLMQDLPGGSMLSVSLSKEEVLRFTNNKIQLAAVNAPKLSVVAGPSSDIDELSKKLTALEINNKKLHTSHAFHSNMMDPIVDVYENIVSKIKLRKPTINIYSSVTAKLESDLFTSPKYWAEHMRKPVLFSDTIENVLKHENAILLEVGPRSVLNVLTHKVVVQNKIKNSNIYSTMSDHKDFEISYMLKALGAMWACGEEINLCKLYEENDKIKLPFINYPFSKKRIWLDWIGNKANSTTNSHIETKSIKETLMVMPNKLEQLKDRLSDIFEQSSGINVNEFDDDSTFLEMGMDSLFLTQIAIKIKKNTEVEVSFRQLSDEYNTIVDLAEFMLDKVPETLFKQEEQQVVVQEASSPTQQSPKANIGTLISNNTNGNVQDIINQQLQIMNQQLQVLSGSATVPVASNSNIKVNKVISQKVKTQISTKKTSVDNAKKAYGAIARITTFSTNELSVSQELFLKEFFDKYSKQSKLSKEFTQRNRVNHSDPRVVTGFRPEMKEVTYPIVVNKSSGQYLWDLDGNKYVDMTNGFGCNFFGYQNPIIKKYVLEQLEEGIETGPQHALTEAVSKLVSELTGNERVAFCNTGSEAVLGAMRIARTVSGKDKIISFNGSYHGIHDEVIIRGAKDGRAISAAPGITDESVSNMIVLEYGTEESLEIIKSMIHEVAAVLVEPVQSRRCDFQPKEFLQKLSKITKEADTCLIFDEVITGFRIKVGGAQEYFGADADLCTYGKIVGGGMPIGMVAGSAKYMDALDGGYWNYGDDSTPTVGVTYFAGTFVRHPLALAAAKGALEIIKNGGNKQLDDLTNRAQLFVDNLNAYFNHVGAPIKFDCFGGLMKPKWTQDLYHGDLLFALMKFHGVHVYDGYPWYMNLAHKEEDIVFVTEKFKLCINIMQKEGFIPAAKDQMINDKTLYTQNTAPQDGAQLGVDEEGNPAWYIEDKNNNGKLKKIV